jgi:diguanylate cyclase (GGDEF)-like protein
LGADDFAFADPGLARTFTRLLDGLRRNVEDRELYACVYGGLKRFGRQGEVDLRCVSWIHEQLNRYADDPIALPRQRIKARLVQQHLVVFLADSPEAATVQAVEESAAKAPPVSEPPKVQGKTNGNGGAHNDTPADPRTRYNRLKRSEQDAWNAIYTTVTDFSKLKELWVSSLDDIGRERDELAQRLTAATDRLREVEQEGQLLRTEIERLREAAARRPAVRALPRAAIRQPRRTLARREQFVRSLEAEVERVRRHGGPLAVALLDIERLDTFEREHGADAAKAVRNCYAAEILSGFRTYDVVAFYLDDAYAVLFPNTERDGALRALEKARKRATETHFVHEGVNRPLPGFRGGLALYAAGEGADALLARASSALEHARHDEGAQVVAL